MLYVENKLSAAAVDWPTPENHLWGFLFSLSSQRHSFILEKNPFVWRKWPRPVLSAVKKTWRTLNLESVQRAWNLQHLRQASKREPILFTFRKAQIPMQIILLQQDAGLAQVKPTATDGFLVNRSLSCKSLMKMLPVIVMWLL